MSEESFTFPGGTKRLGSTSKENANNTRKRWTDVSCNSECLQRHQALVKADLVKIKYEKHFAVTPQTTTHDKTWGFKMF